MNRKYSVSVSSEMAHILATLIFALGVIALAAGQACPRIVTRAQWNSRSTSTSALRVNPPSHVVIHHTAGSACSTQAACSQQMRNIQNFHMNTNGWADIGYNFLVGGDGAVYEGRGWGRTGAHAPNFNDRSMGIGFIGTFTSALPTAAAMNAAQQLIRCGVAQGRISSSYRLIGHRQASATACPGNTLFNRIRTWPRWVANP